MDHRQVVDQERPQDHRHRHQPQPTPTVPTPTTQTPRPQQATTTQTPITTTTTATMMEQPQPTTSTPPGSYTRIPPRSIDPSAVPPILPPHLLQVILNDPDKANTTILPQPNHVMLNHLYALSIKDGIMVLSATHRFRKKFVTTLLYKPI